MLSPTMRLLSLVILVIVVFAPAKADSIYVANHSFEEPVVPEGIQAYPFVGYGADWIEFDNDVINGFDIGVFPNTSFGSPDHIVNTDANQLAFLGGELGNALIQDLSATYQVGKNYKMTVGICVSNQFRPFDPNGLELAFYYTSPSDPNRIDIVSATTSEPNSFTSTILEDNSIDLPTVIAENPWADKTIGIAIRATGPKGGYWDLDNVRVTEYPLVPNYNEDSIVNLADFAKMAGEWDSCNEPLTDVTGDGCVDEADLLILIEYWLDNV